MTYTYSILEVSPRTYQEIFELLRAEGYTEAFHETADGRTVIDLHGIAIATEIPANQDNEAYCTCRGSNYFVGDGGLTCWKCFKPHR